LERHTSQAVLADAADLVEVAQSNTISNLTRGHVAPDLFHNPNALMTQYLSAVEVVEVGAAEAGVGYADKDLRRFKCTGCFGGNDSAVLVAVEDVKGDVHFDCEGVPWFSRGRDVSV